MSDHNYVSNQASRDPVCAICGLEEYDHQTLRNSELVRRIHDGDAERIEPEAEELKIGQWFWYSEDDGTTKEIVCLTEIGSNYAEVTGFDTEYKQRQSWRLHLDEFDDYCTPESKPEPYLNGRVTHHRDNVRELMNEVRQLTAKLGVTDRRALDEGPDPSETTNALVVAHGTKNIQAHKAALIKAKDKTFPELFNRIEEENKLMAMWMKAPTVPLKAEVGLLKHSLEVLEDRIFMVELYAGLIEEVVQIKGGKPASNDVKISLHQRRHYMDEECLANYDAGGMSFDGIGEFDKWLSKKENRDRILPFPRSVVAFRVRREEKYREGASLSDFIRIQAEREEDERTFLYFRNGSQLYRLSTGIEFDANLFPDREHTEFSGGKLWMRRCEDKIEAIVSDATYQGMLERHAEKMRVYKEARAKWDARSDKWREENWHHCPREPFSDPFRTYESCTSESVYYDDAMRFIARQATQHNRIAIVLQGLLDRSPVFTPHPPWQLWTPEGFTNGIELIYDSTRALVAGDAPDFDAYREKLNAQLKRGDMTVGQRYWWGRKEADKEYERQCASYRVRNPHHAHWEAPYGNPGPKRVDKVVRLGKKGAMFEWERERMRPKWIRNPDNPGYMKMDPTPLRATFTCSVSGLLNVSAYTPGDYKILLRRPAHAGRIPQVGASAFGS